MLTTLVDFMLLYLSSAKLFCFFTLLIYRTDTLKTTTTNTMHRQLLIWQNTCYEVLNTVTVYNNEIAVVWTTVHDKVYEIT